MEPGHEDREYGPLAGAPRKIFFGPQWSPVMKTGNTPLGTHVTLKGVEPQWSPVMKTGNTLRQAPAPVLRDLPQWSPVMKTGNTRCSRS